MRKLWGYFKHRDAKTQRFAEEGKHLGTKNRPFLLRKNTRKKNPIKKKGGNGSHMVRSLLFLYRVLLSSTLSFAQRGAVSSVNLSVFASLRLKEPLIFLGRSCWLLLLIPSLLMGEETTVESNEASYNGETIVLTGAVRVDNALGSVTAERAVLTRDEKRTTQIDFPWIELTTSVTVTLPDGNRLHCERVFLDYTKMTSTFTGTPQVRYIDTRGEVLADRATVDYRETEGSIQPTKVTLFDNVQLIYFENDQYALADSVIYYPDEQLTILEGKENRVLFFDKRRNMQLSAHQVRAKKDAIQGVGDVRFFFGQDEMSKLKDHFKW